MSILHFLFLFLIVITKQGTVVDGTTIQREINQSGAWLCLYDVCPNGTSWYGYGGSILVLADDVTIENSNISGGVSGIAAYRVNNIKILNNTIRNQSGWGIYLQSVSNAVISGNHIYDSIRSCPESPDGCESANIVGLDVQNSKITDNYLYHGGDGIFLNGDGLPSNNNYIAGNTIVASPHNGIELTFAHDNLIENNIFQGSEDGSLGCYYPVWLGGSSATLKNNRASCNRSIDKAINDARDSTSVPTQIRFEK